MGPNLRRNHAKEIAELCISLVRIKNYKPNVSRDIKTEVSPNLQVFFIYINKYFICDKTIIFYIFIHNRIYCMDI